MSENINPMDYMPVRTPDKEYLAELIMQIKGIERSMADFAADTGVTTSMLSRIVNGAYTKSISIDTLVKIMNGAKEQCKITFADLAHANGLETQEEINRRAARDAQRRRRMAEDANRRLQIEEIITSELLAGGYAIRKNRRLRAKIVNLQELFPQEIGGDFRIELIGEAQDYPWHFMINPLNDSNELSDLRKVVNVKDFFRHYATLFLQDAWEPEKLRNRKVSFVFADSGYYEGFLELMQNASIQGDMSAILVDVNNNVVREETSISMNTFGDTTSLFQLEPYDDGEYEEEEIWEEDNNDWEDD